MLLEALDKVKMNSYFEEMLKLSAGCEPHPLKKPNEGYIGSKPDVGGS